MRFRRIVALVVCTLMLAGTSANAEDLGLQSAGPIAFAPDGVLLVAEPMAAKVHAFEIGASEKVDAVKSLNVDNVDAKIAAVLGASADQIRIVDLAVNPANGDAYFSVTRGSGERSVGVIVRINASDQQINELDLGKLEHSEVTLPNPASRRETRRGNQRMNSITDLAFIDGRVYIAGLSNEEFASNLRSVPYPLGDVDEGTSVEIFHGAHGQFETRSPIRTFAAYEIEEETNLLAAYTCTPLVTIPVESLKPNKKIVGKTVAELGNRNRPLDMVVYAKDGHDYILMANSSRGVMRIDLADVAEQVSITEHVPNGGTRGLPYETMEQWQGVVQLDGIDRQRAMMLVKDEGGQHHLRTIELP